MKTQTTTLGEFKLPLLEVKEGNLIPKQTTTQNLKLGRKSRSPTLKRARKLAVSGFTGTCVLLLLTCRRAVRGADPTEEAEEAAGGGNGSHVHRGPRRHAAAGSGHAGPAAARDDREAGGHAEAVQQEVVPGATQGHGESTRSEGGRCFCFTN